MRGKAWLILALTAVVLVACGGPTGAAPSPTPREPQAVMLHLGGLARTYYVLFPTGLTGRLPLVLALHGYTQSVGGLESKTRLNDEAAVGGFVVAYPEGINQSWNAGNCCADAQARNIDDVAFIKQVIDQLVSGGRVDPKRIFATGISNGGMMDYRLACELSDRIAAIASVSGALEVDTCSPARAVSVLEMHGTDDASVPIGGGTLPAGGAAPPTISTMKRWIGIDGCTTDSITTTSDITEITRWTGCRDSSTVVLVVVKSGGHTFWLDHVPAQLNVNQYIWDFFKSVPLRS